MRVEHRRIGLGRWRCNRPSTAGRAPTHNRSLTFIATQSIPIVSYRFISCATMALDPTPSVEIASPIAAEIDDIGEIADIELDAADAATTQVVFMRSTRRFRPASAASVSTPLWL